MFISFSCQYPSLYSVLLFMSYILDVNRWLESWQFGHWFYTVHYRAVSLLNEETIYTNQIVIKLCEADISVTNLICIAQAETRPEFLEGDTKYLLLSLYSPKDH